MPKENAFLLAYLAKVAVVRSGDDHRTYIGDMESFYFRYRAACLKDGILLLLFPPFSLLNSREVL
jgi:hypothetical protein